MRENILIVEDEASIADNIAYALESEGFIPVRAGTVEDGERALRVQEIALVILDIGLPDCSGLEFCKRIRRRSNVPIIFLTARSDEVDRIVGLEIGGDDYVTKPFSPRELTARVKAVLRRGKPRRGSKEESFHGETTNSGFHVDSNALEIAYLGTPLTLSRYEFKILETLAAHPGRVFSRRQLMERAWEEPDASMERTVDTHIKTIRSKLREVKPDDDPIVTHRGFGYALRLNRS